MILGVDVSKWQGEMSWEVTAAAGAQFAFVRAGSINNVTGVCYTDYQFVRNASFAPEHMPVGYYWYFRPQFDPVKQADYFCDLIENEDQLLQPVLDAEYDAGLSDVKVTAAMAAFIAQVYARRKVWTIIYSRAEWLNVHTNAHPLFDECDLWIARYNRYIKHPWEDAVKYPILKPQDWDDWTFWQFSADGNGRGKEFGGGAASIDLNYFNGDEAEFNEYINKPQPPVQVQLPASGFVKLNFEIDGKDVKYQGTLNLVE